MQLLINRLIAFFVLITVFACNSPSGQKGSGSHSGSTEFQEGRDYFKLIRFRLNDQQGFGQPVEAASFLLPADWKTSGGIQWNQVRCLTDMIQSSVHAVSPDNRYEFFVLPIAQFDWCDNPQTRQAMQNGDVGLSCQIAEPADAASYISNTLGGLVNARVTSTSVLTEYEQSLKQQAAMNQIPGYRFEPSAAEGKLSFPDGSEGLAFCQVTQTINSMPDMAFGQGTINYFQTAVNARIVLRYPAGEEVKGRQLLSTILGSIRMNPAWVSAIQTMMQNIKKNIQDETWKRIQISYQAQQEISNNIVRGWEARNSSSSGESSSNSTQLFGEYLRGVDNWTDGDGNKVELASGYSYAWQHADGSYILSNTHGFDPNVAFGETWKPLNK